MVGVIILALIFGGGVYLGAQSVQRQEREITCVKNDGSWRQLSDGTWICVK